MVGKRKKQFELILPKEEIVKICTRFGDKLSNAVFQDGKLERENAVTAIKEEAKAAIIEK
jgi:polyribonucleotide nucleotidyltransferase